MGRHKPWKTGKPQGNDITSCRGHGIFLATCQSARERETSRELVNLITDVIEDIYPAEDVPSVPLEEQQSLSIEEMIRREVEAAKGGNRSSKDNSFTQKAVSILTDVKGIVIIKLSKRKYCPVKILSHIIEKIEHDRIPLTRYVVRLIPLQVTFFPKQDELADNIPYLLHSHLPGIELPQKRKKGENFEGDNEDDSVGADEEDNADALPQHNEDVNTRTDERNAAKKQRVDESGNAVVVSLEEPTVAIESATEISEPTTTVQKIRYSIEYKGRNHNVLNREMVYVMFNQRLRDYGVVDYRNPEVVIFVEAFKNLGGMSWIEHPEKFHDFNIRKLQENVCSLAKTSADNNNS